MTVNDTPQSEYIASSLRQLQYYLTLNVTETTRIGIEKLIAEREAQLAEQLKREAEPGYTKPDFIMPEWGTYGT